MDAAAFQLHSAHFLADLSRSPATPTLRAYRADLRHLTAWLGGTGRSLAAYFAAYPQWAPLTRNRKQTTLE
ncbi:hypothetical protein [Deinococcus sp. S9]|uniref:hypothetical protein n=1 Tax=Deinococcus sp. S9 TaxID=2545754 RepID=UPI00197ECC0F|nr:hypothetical protein [Deinococcus sp. S9]